MLTPDTIFPPSDIGYYKSIFFVYGVGGVAFLGGIVVLLRKMIEYGKLEEAANAAMTLTGPLQAGLVIVVGVVEKSKKNKEIVKVEVTQEGEEKESSGVWSHSWKEVKRQVKTAPFYLRCSDGERIRVEPCPEVFLIDDMDGHILVDQKTRSRFAQLVPGEEIIAKGMLSSGHDPEGMSDYRSLPKGWILRAPKQGQLYLSSEPLSARFAHWRRFYMKSLVIFLLVFLAIQAVLHADHLRFLDGETELVVVVSKDTYETTDDDGDTTTHYTIESTTPWGDTYDGNVNRLVYVEADVGMEIPLRHSNQRYLQYGAHPTLNVYLAGMLTFTWLIVLFLYRRAKKMATPWYLGKLEDHSSGRLNSQTGLLDRQGLSLEAHEPK